MAKSKIKPFELLLGKDLTVTLSSISTDYIQGIIVEIKEPLLVIEYHSRKTTYRSIVNVNSPYVKDIQASGDKGIVVGSEAIIELEYRDTRDINGVLLKVEDTTLHIVSTIRNKVTSHFINLANPYIQCEIYEKS